MLLENEKHCKKHWKNIRDRFVKVMHQRDRHFFLGGSEVEAPQYIYFDKLLFMREFSVKKDPRMNVKNAEELPLFIRKTAPERLIHEESKTKDGTLVQIKSDYTIQFLELVKQFPELYDEYAELKRYRSKEAWKQIADELNKFTVGKLRAYWARLVKQYQIHLMKLNTNSSECNNNSIFSKMTFVNAGNYNQQHKDECSSSRDYVDDLSEEEFLCEEVDEVFDDEINEEFQDDIEYEETSQAVESIEAVDIEMPEPKKMKIEPEELSTQNLEISVRQDAKAQQISRSPATNLQTPSTEDDFDYFGKKVALQLRDIAQKNRSLARKGEIKVLQLLLNLEESLEQ